jgi:hypothetical protein
MLQLRGVVKFLYQDDNMQRVAYGTKRARKTGGTWVMLPAATRRKPHNQLWKDYSTHCASAGTERVSKAHFYMAVNTSTKGQDKPLAALSVQKIKGTKTFLMIEELIALLCPGASQPLARAALFELTATTQAFLHDDFRAHLAHDAETNAELPLPCHCGQHSLRFALSGDEDMGYGIPADETAFTQHCSDCGRVELLLQSLAHLIDIAGDAEAVQLGGETKSSLHRFLKRIESRQTLPRVGRGADEDRGHSVSRRQVSQPGVHNGRTGG